MSNLLGRHEYPAKLYGAELLSAPVVNSLILPVVTALYYAKTCQFVTNSLLQPLLRQ